MCPTSQLLAMQSTLLACVQQACLVDGVLSRCACGRLQVASRS